MKLQRSPLFYVGDKYKILKQIIPYFPKKIDKFIEPFIGGGSVFLNVEAKKYLLNDIDKNLYSIHKFLIESSNNNKDYLITELTNMINYYKLSCSAINDIVPLELKKQYKKTYYSKFNKIAYEILKKDFNKENLKDPKKLYLLIIYGFNRMIRFNGKKEFNVPVGNVDFNKNVMDALKDYLIKVSTLNIELMAKDYKEFIDEIKVKKEDFIYLDPPYLITSSEYNKIWNEKNEIELLNFLDELNNKKIRFAISNVTHFKEKINKHFLEWSKKYNSYEITSNYISYHDNSLKNIKEVLVTNY